MSYIKYLKNSVPQNGSKLLVRIWLWVIIVCLLVLFTFLYAAHRDVKRLYGDYTEKVEHRLFRPYSGAIAITNVSVLAEDSQEFLNNKTILIKQGYISGILDGIPTLDPVLEIDGSGKYLVPGFIDSHTHIMHSENDLLLYLANGITQIRELAGSQSQLYLRDEINAGRLAPTMYVASPQLDTDSFWFGLYRDFTRFSHNVYDPNRAIEDVKDFAKQSYDAIKLYDLNVETYRAINQVARQMNIPTVGHLPNDMVLDDLAVTQQLEIAHIEELVKLLIRDFGSIRQQGVDDFRAYVTQRSNKIAEDLAKNGIAVHSVLWFMESLERQFVDLHGLLSEIELEYANPGIVEGNEYAGLGWLPGQNRFQMQEFESQDDNLFLQKFWQARKDAHHILLKAMIANKVTILVGTDSNADLVVPGFSLHDELIALNRAGLSPEETLKAATSDAADIIGSKTGKIKVGNIADLVLLNGNPLLDIGHSSNIDAVVTQGRYLDRQLLDNMLAAVLHANDNSRQVNIDIYRK